MIDARNMSDEELFNEFDSGNIDAVAELMRRDRVQWGEEVPTTLAYAELVGGW